MTTTAAGSVELPDDSDLERLEELSTVAARSVFAELFVEPVRVLFTTGAQPIPRKATDVYTALGRGWARTLAAIKANNPTLCR